MESREVSNPELLLSLWSQDIDFAGIHVRQYPWSVTNQSSPEPWYSELLLGPHHVGMNDGLSEQLISVSKLTDAASPKAPPESMLLFFLAWPAPAPRPVVTIGPAQGSQANKDYLP